MSVVFDGVGASWWGLSGPGPIKLYLLPWGLLLWGPCKIREKRKKQRKTNVCLLDSTPVLDSTEVTAF